MKVLAVAALVLAVAVSVFAYLQYSRAEASTVLANSNANNLAETAARLQDSTAQLQSVQGDLAARQSELADTQGKLAAGQSELADTQGKLRDANTALETTRASLQDMTSRNATLTQQVTNLTSTAGATNRAGPAPTVTNTVACAYADTQGYGVIYTIEFPPETIATVQRNTGFCSDTSDVRDNLVKVISISDFQTRTRGLRPVCDVPFPYQGNVSSRVFSLNDPSSAFAAAVCKHQVDAAAKKP